MIRNALQRFMYGRYGSDQLNRFLTITYLVLFGLYFITGFDLFYFLCTALIFVVLFRMLSRNISRRRAENTKFLTSIRPLKRRFSSLRNQLQDKEHRFFRCPNCKQQMRVPKGKGRIQVTCRNCGASFEEKS